MKPWLRWVWGSVIVLVGGLLVLGLGLIMPAATTKEFKGTVNSIGFRESRWGGTPFMMVTLENGKTVKANAPLGIVFKKDEKAIIQEGVVFFGWNRYKFIRYLSEPARSK